MIVSSDLRRLGPLNTKAELAESSAKNENGKVAGSWEGRRPDFQAKWNEVRGFQSREHLETTKIISSAPPNFPLRALVSSAAPEEKESIQHGRNSARHRGGFIALLVIGIP